MTGDVQKKNDLERKGEERERVCLSVFTVVLQPLVYIPRRPMTLMAMTQVTVVLVQGGVKNRHQSFDRPYKISKPSWENVEQRLSRKGVFEKNKTRPSVKT